MCKGYLPTNKALASKCVVVNAQCPWCHRGIEDDVHVLFSCDFARTVWLSAGLPIVNQMGVCDTAFEIIFKIFEQCTKEQQVKAAMLCWSIWFRRNKWVWEKANGSVFGVQTSANNLLKDWKEAQLGGENEAGARLWSKPAEGWVKANIDAAVFSDGSIGIGGVIRDSQGQFLGARSRRIRGAWQPREAEAIGLKEALSWVIDQGYSHCIFETDSAPLAAACNGSPGNAYFGALVGDCLHLLKHINPVLVVFAYRSTNRVAHALAKASYSLSDLGEWYVTPPMFLKSVLEFDMV